ncbi:hypothetical protein CsSME_00048827 [Camellia sinensis var. sinensis]
MEEYLTQIKEISNQLRLASSMVDDEDMVLRTLNGLPEEYDAHKTAIRAQVQEVDDIEEVDPIALTKANLEDTPIITILTLPSHSSSTSSGSQLKAYSY